MKILAISHSALLPTYQEKYEYLANEFDNQVLLITQKERIEGGGKVVKSEPRKKGNLIVNPQTSLLTNSLRRHFYPFLRFAMGNFKPDVVYAEIEPQAEAALQGLKIARQYKSKFVFFTWENIEQSYSGRKERIEKLIHQESSGAIVGNEEGMEILTRQGFKSPIAVIPQYGISPKIFKPIDAKKFRQKLGIDNYFVLGYVGRLLPEKNIASLIQALRKLPERVILLIVGSGPEKTNLKKLISRKELDKRVKFIKAVDHTKIPILMNSFDALVLPSITISSWKEQFGRVLAEAMACKTPVIGSDSGEIPNVIDGAGMIFPAGNINKLAIAIRSLMSSEKLKQELSEKGYKRALSLYTNESIARQMDLFFKQINSKI